ncbi:MAG: FAD-dependent oxidoreductase [Pseudomonadota bacterium]
MHCNPRYNILFEPITIGPVVAPNRFYQTPHATGMGRNNPNSSAALRAIKAEGGWGVVCTEYCSIHPSSDETPYAYLTLWDDDDMRQLAQTTDAIHAHGSLAGIELWHGGFHVNNRGTRETPIAPTAGNTEYVHPGQVRAMTHRDIQDMRAWQRAAAIRARDAGFDIVYVYAGHEYLPFQFLSRRFNQRDDEYGGSLENRTRLLREMIEDTRDAVGQDCAVAVRLAIDELHGNSGITSENEGRDVVEMLAELPDLWDIALGGSLGTDSCSSRFSAEGYQEQYANVVKPLTSKPVVSVGRFTSPDAMVSQIKRGVQDFIGAARPSIADPFLPKKIAEGREDEIRECIGCNICRSSNNEGVPLRCTQNPTMGEEWRRGWHPENIPAKHTDASVLIVGGGPAGLEAALALGKRGYQVDLAEQSEQLGGRLLRESTLPGLAHWIRVRDYRVNLLQQMPNVNVYTQSEMTSDDVREFEADYKVMATGSRWRRDGVGATARTPLQSVSDDVLTPDDIFSGADVTGDVLIYDDDHYFMAGALAEKFLRAGHRVTYVTPESIISSWTVMTNEQEFIQTRLMELGIEAHYLQRIDSIEEGLLNTACAYTAKPSQFRFDTLILATSRESDQSIVDSLGDSAISLIGDCRVPSSIADAVYSGHKFAREVGVPRELRVPRREQAIIFSDLTGAVA